MSAGFAAPAYIAIPGNNVDWESVTGLNTVEYRIGFKNTKAAGDGWEMYYLNEFPCFGAGTYVYAWVSAKDSSAEMRVLCVRRPKEVKLAYRPAKKGATEGRTVGMLTCNIEKDLSVDLGGCKKESWADFAKD
jgi:hypothetical protein